MCPTYDPGQLLRGVREHLDYHLGGADLRGKRVLLKVNLLSGRPPGSAVTTHPEFVRAVILALKERGASCIIGDSPGGPFTKEALDPSYEISGYRIVAEQTGAALNHDVSWSEVPLPSGRFVKRLPIANYIRGADMVIALPKVKTHMLAGLTCATKVMFGAVPGIEKVRLHGRFQSPDAFSRMLLDLAEHVKPDLFLVDGIVGMEGEGPAKGDPRRIGMIASGTDHVEIDRHVCDVIGLDPRVVPLFDAFERTRGRPVPVPVVKGAGSNLRMDPPFVPAKGWSIARQPPPFLGRIARELLSGRPVISQEKCIGCMFCARNCASDAIIEKDGKAVIERSKCSRCYCCHELCPHGAVDIRDPPKLAGAILDGLFDRIGR